MVASMFAGCGNKAANNSSAAGNSAADNSAAESTNDAAATETGDAADNAETASGDAIANLIAATDGTVDPALVFRIGNLPEYYERADRQIQRAVLRCGFQYHNRCSI